jgi:hypothetical protein
LVEIFRHAFDRLDLVNPVDDRFFRVKSGQLSLAFLGLEQAILQAVLRVEAEEAARRLAFGIVPDKDLAAVRINLESAVKGLR